MRPALTCLVLTTACAPITGDRSVEMADVRRLRLTTDTLLITGPDAEGSIQGTAIQSLSRTKLGERGVIMQVFWHRSAATGVETLDSLWMSDPDLRPLRHTRHSSHSQVSLDYLGHRVRGHTSSSGERRDVDDVLPRNTFDGAAMDLVARGLQLQEGVAVRLSFYLAGLGIVPATARIVGRDTIVTRSGQRALARAILLTLGEEEILVHVSEDTADLLQVTEHPNSPSPTRYRR
jgi:hypothetical protein